MQIKLLHNLVEEMAGENTGRIVDILFGKRDVNEFLIAKKMELTINQVRNILYKLSADGLVSFVRKKDKRKGWYIYYWTLKTEKCMEKLELSLVKKIDDLISDLRSRETKRFYVCKSCAIEVSEEKALDNGFSCEECAEVYELSDNSGPIRDTKAKITRTEKSLILIQNELKIIREKKEKKRARVSRKLEKKEDERKTLMKVARATARKKIAEDKKKIAKEKVIIKKKVVKKAIVRKKVAKKVLAKKKVSVKKKATVKKKAVKKKANLVSKLKKKLSGKK